MGLIRIVGTKIGTNNSWLRAPLGAHQPLWLACCCWDSDVDSSGHNMVVCITQLFHGKGHFGKGTDVDPLHIKRSRHIQWYMSGCISRRFHQPSTLSLRSFNVVMQSLGSMRLDRYVFAPIHAPVLCYVMLLPLRLADRGIYSMVGL